MFTAWSYSRYNDWVSCPFKANLKHNRKLKEPDSPAMARGSLIHKLAEAYTKTPGECPPELREFAEEFKYIQGIESVGVEQQWAFTDQWAPTGWFDRNAWCRLVVDLYWLQDDMLVLVDHKTGKINEDHLPQLSLYALGGFLKFPEAQRVKVELWYLDHGVVKPEPEKVYDRLELAELKKHWQELVKPMMSDRVFPPKPGSACRWCHWQALKGGPCRF